MSLPELQTKLLTGALSALIGCGIGWGATALTLAGRVDAIEKGQARVESLILQLIHQKAPGNAPNK